MAREAGWGTMADMGAGDEQVLDEADRNMVEMWRHLVARGPAPDATEAHGLVLLSSGLPTELFNPVHVVGEVADPAAAVAAVLEHYAGRGVPFELVFRESVAPGLVEACEAVGLVEHWQ